MPVTAIYIFKIILCSGILFGYYWLALRNKIFHQYNRFYLLASVVLSLVLPFVQINIWQHTATDQTVPVRLLKVVSGGNEYLDEIIVTAQSNPFTTTQLLQLLYCSVSFIFLFIFIRSLVKIYRLYKNHTHTVIEKIHLVNTRAEETPFSFLKYIFWNTHIDINSSTGTQIFKHELAHATQKHTHDKLFINIIIIFLWCNPFYWLTRKELNMIHEFIADKTAVEDNDTAAFANMILQAAYPQQQFHLTNPFFYSPIKRRLFMLTKNNSNVGYIGRVLVLPLLLLTFAAFSFKTKTITQNRPLLYHDKPITVVIDAGHGGKDFGAKSLDAELYEKDITLAIIKKIKALNSNKNIHIILTRETDIYQSPPEKAAMVNKLQADLMISIHTDGTTRDSADFKSGMSFFVARDGFQNSIESKLLASVLIAAFKNNNMGLPIAENPQQRPKGIWLLQASKCPAVIVETGYITNKKDLAFLTTETNQEQIARTILTGIESYAANVKEMAGQAATIIQADAAAAPAAPVKQQPQPEKSNPIYVVNGEVNTKEYVATIAPEDIEKIDVLKNKNAIDKYGEAGKNGVVEITLKKVLPYKEMIELQTLKQQPKPTFPLMTKPQ